jgi:hypothetical protein
MNSLVKMNIPSSPFLAVQTSFWPFLISLRLFSLMANALLYFQFKVSLSIVLASLLFVVLVSFL